MNTLLTELKELEQRRKDVMAALVHELVIKHPIEFEDYDLTNQVSIALDDSWTKHKGEFGSQGCFDINYSMACDGACFKEYDILYQDASYTLVDAEIYDDANYYSGLILLSTNNYKGE